MGWNKPRPRLTYDCGADDKPNCHICIQQLIMFVFVKLNERENRKSSNTSLFFIYCIQLLALCLHFIYCSPLPRVHQHRSQLSPC